MNDEKRYIGYLEDIINSMQKLLVYKDLDLKSLSEQELWEKQSTIERTFEIIGEASNNIPKDVLNKYSHIPWARMIALRNTVIHNYGRVDINILLNIIRNHFADNLKDLQEILQKERDND